MTPMTSPVPGVTAPLPADAVLRPLRPDDLDAVVALDRLSAGLARRPYFEKRLAAALRSPRRHLQFALTAGTGLAGFLVARIVGGEYGRPEEVVVLEALGVDPTFRREGLGRRLLTGLETLMHSRGIHRVVTQVDWRNHGMLQFLAGAGFSLAPRSLLERPLERLPGEDERRAPLVRQLKAADFEQVTRIDKRLTGVARPEYFQRKFDEVLQQSAIEVSLVAEEQGFVVAFAMARVDFGDFGRVAPAASLDTIGVDPGFARKGFGKAVLSQMIENLAALHVERLETEVAFDDFGLLQFLAANGFRPAQGLCFERQSPGEG